MNGRLKKLELRSRAFKLIKEKSFRVGQVQLASGKSSNFYFDMKPTMFDPEGAWLLTELILQELQGVKADAIGGMVMGAVPLISPVVIKSREHARHLPGFFIRKEPKDHGTKQLIEGADITGKDVVILDDVTTTGGSAMEAVRVSQAAGARVTLVLSVVDRGEGAVELYERSGIPFRALFRAAEFNP